MPVRTAMTTISVDSAIGQSLYAHRPTGPDARRWERFGNEIQMLLFALNDQDGTGRPVPWDDGEPRPNGVWFWGGGEWPDDVATRLAHVRALAAQDDTSDAADLARGLMLLTRRVPEALPAALQDVLAQTTAIQLAPVPAVGDAPASTRPASMRAAATPAVDTPIPTTLVVLPALLADDLLATHWLAPALTALEQRRITQLTVMAGNAPTSIWSATPPSFITRLRARFAPRSAATARA